MGYRKAEEILPVEIIELIQQYVDGQPARKSNRSCACGTSRFIPSILRERRCGRWRRSIISP